MSAEDQSKCSPTIQTIDQLLSHYSKILEAGQSVSIPLYKGASTLSPDPFKRVPAKVGPDKCSSHLFPRMAKFSETTVKPDFLTVPWKDARLYEEDIPKDDSDEDEEDKSMADGSNTAAANNTDITSTNTQGSSVGAKTKKRRWKRFEPPKRHWVLQEHKEFMEKLYIKQLKKTDPARSLSLEKLVAARLSQRYHGSSEDKNTSQYAIMSFHANTSISDSNIPTNPSSLFSISLTRIHGFHNFTQPYKSVTLSMQDAERFISDRRAQMTRYMMHGKISEKLTSKYFGPGCDKEDGEEVAKAAAAVHVALASSGGSMGIYGPAPKGGLVKARLFHKLMNPSNNHQGKSSRVDGNHEDIPSDGDDDDVMADVAFRESKGVGRTMKARRELLSTFGGDGSLAIDDNGVISGSNDAEFASKRQVFNRYMNQERDVDGSYDGDDDLNDDIMNNTSSGKASDDRGVAASTSEGLAMDEDFYQRDVAMEYEDLDYDANEQFDDDDVDLGEENEDIGDFTADVDDDDEEEEEDLEDDEEEDGSDDIVHMSPSSANINISKSDESAPKKEGPGGSTISDTDSATDNMGDESSTSPPEKKMKLTMEDAQRASISTQATSPAVQMDENGDRVLTFDGVRKEIWLHSGRILLMQLAKIYNINKKTSAERRSKFVAITKELCNPEDTIDGKMLVLKQHYSKLG